MQDICNMRAMSSNAQHTSLLFSDILKSYDFGVLEWTSDTPEKKEDNLEGQGF
jgi:hypothetical protein